MKRYNLAVSFTEPVLGSAPCDPEVYKRFIESRKPEPAAGAEPEDESATVGQREEAGWTVFRRDENGLFFYDYQIRGFLKEAAAAVTGTAGMSAFKSKINKWLFVTPRRIYLVAGGKPVTEAKDVLERPLRAMTMQGPRVTLARSDQLPAGTAFSAVLSILPLGEKEFTEDVLRGWLDYGALSGLGQWRTGSWGRFAYELESLAS